MRRALVPFLLVFSLVSAPLAARQHAVRASAPLAVPGIDAIAQHALDQGIPGVIISVKKRNAYFHKAWGFSDTDAHVARRDDDVFQVGSVTKQFTAAAILRLEEAGKLHVFDRIRTWLPELDARFDAITIEQLLTHTAGLGDYLADLGTDLFATKSEREILALIASKNLLFAPGSHWSYSNSGYYLLGVIVERAANEPYDQFLRDTFFTPLGLDRTSYCGTNGPVPSGYYLDVPSGATVPMPNLDVSILYSAGGICSTANDLLRWNHALVSGAAISTASYARMTTGVRPTEERPPGYGYALVIDRLDGRRWIWHNGIVFGFQTHLAWFPDEDLTIAVSIDVDAVPSELATPIAIDVARAMAP
ncbi:MAG: beta-lactamase family protein [Acidobacteria bacterium]|nr:beta-lactamase family protein [Acidobacteriota bacterium]MBV9476561.1 beta-lactamase family protein [Acidobacteriota bacterium]